MDITSFMEGSTNPILAAMLLGLITAVSPCPLATNMTAIAYLSRKITDRGYAVTAGAFYTLGRMVSYSVLGILLIVFGLEVTKAASFLQGTGEYILGPLLIAVGIMMLIADRISFGTSGKLLDLGGRLAKRGLLGGFLLGVVFALMFCPYSAVVFFGVLIPLSINTSGGITLPVIFAIGTGLPVLVIGTLFTLGIARVSSWLNALNTAQKYIRIIMAFIFVGVGVYYFILGYIL